MQSKCIMGDRGKDTIENNQNWEPYIIHTQNANIGTDS